ncbi:MAG: hypothetical protein PHI56_02145 [Victivallaceae bacterium]|nr:hypothetical protein [Victivallaceae bacterium]
MDNASQKKRKRDLRWMVIEAVILTLVIHAVFFFFFDYQAPKPREVEIKPYKTMMLNLHDTNRLSLRSVSGWLKYQNPAVMSRPDYRFGYSRIGALPKWRSLATLPSASPPELSWRPMIAPFHGLDVEPSHMEVATAAELAGFSTAEPNFLDVVQPVLTEFKYPLVLSGGLPVDKVDLSLIKLTDDIKTATPTRMRIFSSIPGMMPRLLLSASSGNAELDLAAGRMLLDFALKNPPQEWDGREMEIYWHAGESK